MVFLPEPHPTEKCTVPEGRRAGWDSFPYKSVSCSSLISLSRYNPHIIKFAIVEYTVQWFLAYSQDCATIATDKFRSIVITLQRNLTHALAASPGFRSLRALIFQCSVLPVASGADSGREESPGTSGLACGGGLDARHRGLVPATVLFQEDA